LALFTKFEGFLIIDGGGFPQLDKLHRYMSTVQIMQGFNAFGQPFESELVIV